MKQTVGTFDRNVRLILGSVFLLAGIAGYVGLAGLAWIGIGQALASVVLVLVGAILLITGGTRMCLVYSLLGIDSMGRRAESETSKEETEPPTERAA